LDIQQPVQYDVSHLQNASSIIVIGAGGIVRSAHLPAYQLAGFPVKGIYDIDAAKAADTAAAFGIPKCYGDLNGLLQEADKNTVIDIAIPAAGIIEMLQQLPDGVSVLIQKPMGESLQQAKEILQLCRENKLNAGVNFQLRYAPFIIAARKMIKDGLLGELCDIEVNVNVYTPWHLWEFLFALPRVEILYHSIHYIDLIRSFLGNPSGMFAKTVKHPDMMQLASVRSNIIMDYGDRIRANILTNHAHKFGLHNQQSYIKFEGTKGAIKIELGLLKDYPKGVPDEFEYVLFDNEIQSEWKQLKIEGSWFPHAFIGSMAEIMKSQNGEIARPDNSVEDCIYTMACVEAAYQSGEEGMKRVNFVF
jgi:predicted dehydrogenase